MAAHISPLIFRGQHAVPTRPDRSTNGLFVHDPCRRCLHDAIYREFGGESYDSCRRKCDFHGSRPWRIRGGVGIVSPVACRSHPVSIGPSVETGNERDRALICAIASGDRAAFEEIHSRYSARIRAFALKRTRRRDLAEELTCETLTTHASAPSRTPRLRTAPTPSCVLGVRCWTPNARH